MNKLSSGSPPDWFKTMVEESGLSRPTDANGKINVNMTRINLDAFKLADAMAIKKMPTSIKVKK